MRGKVWHLALGLVLIALGLEALGWLSISSDIMGIGEVVTGVLVLINK